MGQSKRDASPALFLLLIGLLLVARVSLGLATRVEAGCCTVRAVLSQMLAIGARAEIAQVVLAHGPDWRYIIIAIIAIIAAIAAATYDGVAASRCAG